MKKIIKESEICIKYNNGAKNKDLALEYNVDRHVIQKILKKNNIKLRRIWKINNEQKLQIIKKYENGKTIKELSLEYKINRGSVWKLLKNENINIRPDHLTQYKYTLNQNYFDKIDTYEKAYFFGFNLGDGSNNEKRNTIQISLQEQDKEILDKFNIAIDSNRSLRYRNLSEKNPNWSNQYRLAITNKHMSEKLAKHGMVASKTHKLKFPYKINKKFYPSLILGIFDADGCIYITKKAFVFTITGTKSFLIEVQKILMKELGLNKTKFNKRWKDRDNSITALTYGGRKQCLKIRDWLYKNSPVYLTRKRDKFYSIKEPI